jgi:hypothetical protein
VIVNHISGVIHDLAWSEWLVDANRIMRDKDISGEIKRGYGFGVYDALTRSITSIAVGNIPPQHMGEKLLGHMRNGATVAALGFSATTALVQPLGIFPVIARVGPKWVLMGARKWMHGTPDDHRITRDWVADKSPAMKTRWNHRHTNINRELGDLHQNLLGRGVFDGKVRDAFFWHIVETQSFVDVVAWIAGYEKALSEGNDDARAVWLADSLVKDTQGSGSIQDLANVQAAGPAWKLMTNFYSFFNTMQNITAEEYHRLLPAEGPKHRARYVGFLITALWGPAVIQQMMMDALRQDYDDDEELLEYVARLAITEPAMAVAMLHPILRDFMPDAIRRVAGGADYGTPTPTGWRLIEELHSVTGQLIQGELDHAAVNAGIGVIAVATKTPATALIRLVRTQEYLEEGGDIKDAPLAWAVGPPSKANR